MFARLMKPRITLITLAVDDLEKAVRFYREGLGLKLALWPRSSLAHDAGIGVSHRSRTEFSIGHNVASKAEVDNVLAQAASAGALIVKAAHDTFWGGYAGYFQDPDEHLWEVAWNPQWIVPE